MDKYSLVKQIIDNKMQLGKDIYLTHANGIYLFVDTKFGKVHRLHSKYSVIVSRGNVLVVEDFNSKIVLNRGDNELDLTDITVSKYIKLSRGKYDGVRLGTRFTDCVKVHTIVLGMVCGYDALLGVGQDRTHDIHHKKAWGVSKDNSIGNLTLISKKAHNKIHDIDFKRG